MSVQHGSGDKHVGTLSRGKSGRTWAPASTGCTHESDTISRTWQLGEFVPDTGPATASCSGTLNLIGSSCSSKHEVLGERAAMEAALKDDVAA